MARLPIPGDDEGAWGGILNDYLSQAHAADGTLKSDSVGASQLQDNAVTSSSVADNSIPQSKIQNLAADLSAKANDAVVVHAAGAETISGNKNFTGTLTRNSNAVVDTTDARLADARAPLAHKTTHVTGGTDALTPGDINAVSLGGSNIATLASSALQYTRVNVPNDGSDSATWPDRMAFYYAGIRTGYHNEYGELRARPGKQNTVALRAMGFSPSSSGDIFQVASGDVLTTYFGVSQTQVTANIPVIAPNLPRKITTSATAPSNPQDGDIWFDTSGA